jgi:ACS family hexuronate transporter-like MFS transporter
MANVYAIISDIFPRNAIGSVTGLSTLSAVTGGLVYANVVAFILETTGSYFLIFLLSGFAYLISWMILRLGIPDIKPISFHANN